MAWMETDPVSESVRFISARPSREESVSALAIRVGVSRKPQAVVHIKKNASDRHRQAGTWPEASPIVNRYNPAPPRNRAISPGVFNALPLSL